MNPAIASMEAGRFGTTLFADTTARAGSWGKIVVLETAVFTTLTDPHRDGTEIAGVSFPAGAVIHGAFEAIELASGKVLAYRG